MAHNVTVLAILRQTAPAFGAHHRVEPLQGSKGVIVIPEQPALAAWQDVRVRIKNISNSHCQRLIEYTVASSLI